MLIGISGKKQSGKSTVSEIIRYLITKDTIGYNHPESIGDLHRFQINGHADKSTILIKAFADKVKDIVCILTGCTKEQLENEDFKSKKLDEKWRVYYAVSHKLKIELNPKGKVGSYYSTDVEAYIEIEKLHQKYDMKCTLGTHIPTYRELLQWTGTDFGRRIIGPDIWINATLAEYKAISPSDHDEGGFNYSKWIISDCRFPNEKKAIEDRGGFVIRVERPRFIKDAFGFTIDNEMESHISHHPSEIALDDTKFKYTVQNNGTIDELIVKIKEILLKEKII